MEFYKKLKVFRAHLGLSQAEIADKLQVTQRTYSNYETGRHQIPAKIVPMLVGLGLSEKWWNSGEGPMLKSEVAKSANGVNLDNLTHRQKVEVVIGEITQLYEAAGPEKADRKAVERLIEALTELAQKNNWTLPKIYEFAETLLKHSLAEPDQNKR